MRAAETGYAVTDASGRTLFWPVGFGNMRPALAMHCSRILRIHCRLTRTVCVAHEPAQVEPVVLRNFTPTLAALMQRDNIVKTLARSVGVKLRRTTGST